MHDPDPRDTRPLMPGLAKATAEFLSGPAAGLPDLRAAWIHAPSATASLTLASTGPAAYQDIQAWASAFGAGITASAARGHDAFLYATTRFTHDGIGYDVTAIIAGGTAGNGHDTDDGDSDGSSGQREAA